MNERGNDFIMIKYEYDEQMAAYEAIQKYELDTEVEQTQMKKANDEWGSDFVMVKYQYDEQRAAYND